MEPCNSDIFKNGHGICEITGWAHDIEPWVKLVAAESGQQVDWHYSGGIANVLYLGGHAKVLEAVKKLRRKLVATKAGEKDPPFILRIHGARAHGRYRQGDEVPDGVIGFF